MKTILIVDDSILARNLLRELLSEYDVEILEAENGETGFELYKEHKPLLVTLDICMPEMDGYKTLENIMKFDPCANVLVVSAIGQHAAIIKCMELGAKGYITKPFEKEEVSTKIRKIIH